MSQLVQEVDVENSLLKDRIVELETEVVALNKVRSSTNFEQRGGDTFRAFCKISWAI